MAKAKIKIEWFGDPGWLTTFGDLITLLMTFFVLLISFSTINTEKLEDVIKEMQGKIGILDKSKDMGFSDGVSGQKVPIPEDLANMLEGGSSSKAALDYKKGLYREVSDYLDKSDLNQHMELQLKNEDLILRVQADKIFFRNENDFKEDNLWLIDSLFAVINGVPYDMVISAPVGKTFIPSKRYMSEFDLSIARSIRVCKYFVDKGRIKPKRIGVSDHGKFYSVARNSDIIDNRGDYIEIILLGNTVAGG